MRYVSTRGKPSPKSFSGVLLEGLAPDGGLYTPEEYPKVNRKELAFMRTMNYRELAFAILSRFADDIHARDLRALIDSAYSKENFGSDKIVPIKHLEENLFLLDLCQGPTLAFKDMALQLLGRLFEHQLGKRGDSLNILGATSGDTGSSAEYAMRGRRGVSVFMLSPLNRMSEFQRKQMYTLADENIFNIAIRGTFDDCQDIVKSINEDATFKKRHKLGAVNSINWARIAAQVVYYFWGYFRATNSNEETVDFSVPTGNFGNILAGYVAKQMGLPVKRLILATNENDVLEEFFRTGAYHPRKGSDVHTTSSPSMDISKASNFERYIFDIVGRAPKRMAELWESLASTGSFELSDQEREKVRASGLIAGKSIHADRVTTIRFVYERYKTLIDPHTADGVAVGFKLREKGVPLVCVETAQAAKFAATIRESVGLEPEIPESFQKLASLPERFETLDPDAEAVKAFFENHVV